MSPYFYLLHHRKAKRKAAVGEEAHISSSASGTSPEEDGDEPAEIVELNGTGRLTSSGITVQGHGTKFMEELSVGDASEWDIILTFRFILSHSYLFCANFSFFLSPFHTYFALIIFFYFLFSFFAGCQLLSLIPPAYRTR